jgi:phosphoribosyl-ATP pyrophosphohydrolase/phosphoribosyl-AMP cyclohydrolase
MDQPAIVEQLPALINPDSHLSLPIAMNSFEKNRESIQFLSDLQDLLESRKAEMPEGSYTSKLFAKGTDKIAQKVGEEAVETVIAAKNNREELQYEASDLLFHLMVLLTDRQMRIEDLASELQRRHR